MVSILPPTTPLSPQDQLPSKIKFHEVSKRGGLLAGFPEDPPASSILCGPDLQYYIQRFQISSFRGPLNWYRNIRPNWRWALSARDRKIMMPALMVTAGKDMVLQPKMSKGMEQWVSHPGPEPLLWDPTVGFDPGCQGWKGPIQSTLPWVEPYLEMRWGWVLWRQRLRVDG
ncbi:hypothetical protein AV530_016123 [Patagioenas fasciata monilis]|uniref:Uncharacterized protein n=1 Tax=Patagioenas fasciata monilis TaxID=372326 RepID=A0A1V4L0S3_PATFA|nr:hypothetical protein AV530_016123 [Patagioenas fasciata monilis]